MDFIVGLSVHYGNGDALEQAQCDEALLTIGNTIVFKRKRRTRESAFCVGKIDTAPPKVVLSLSVVPSELHSGILSSG